MIIMMMMIVMMVIMMKMMMMLYVIQSDIITQTTSWQRQAHIAVAKIITHF